MKTERLDKISKTLAIIASILFIASLFFSLTTDKNLYWEWDALFALAIIWAVYFARKKIRLHPVPYFILVLALIIHQLGIFGFYAQQLWGIDYDIWVHTFFGFALGILFFRLNNFKGNFKKEWYRYLLTALIILGISAIHEMVEFAGAVFLGEGEGVLFMGAGDIDLLDTQKDLVSNLTGIILGFGASILAKLRIKK